MNARWRKIGKAYRLADQFSIIWATKAGSHSWRLAYRRGDGHQAYPDRQVPHRGVNLDGARPNQRKAGGPMTDMTHDLVGGFSIGETMKPWHQDDQATIYHGDCREVLRGLPDASVDSIVTDPPYELGFMGKRWDDTGIAYDADLWAECLRVLKPGGHLLAFGGTRTWHRLAVAVEDAGFEVRDSIAWLYGSGFPKSKNVALGIDKGEGHPNRGRAIPTASTYQASDTEQMHKLTSNPVPEYEARSEAARRWSGWGTALKPAFEPVVVARKPLTGTVAANVLEHGVGGLNIDGCRIEAGTDYTDLDVTQGGDHFSIGSQAKTRGTKFQPAAGRWPANVVLDEDQADALDKQSGTVRSSGVYLGDGITTADPSTWATNFGGKPRPASMYGDSGGASRFFYVAKAPAKERPKVDGIAHPTVKPLTLMRWLCRLVTPPGGVVLEPFAGSGTTIEAALMEGFRVVAIEREDDYLPLIAARLERVHQEPDDGQLTFDALRDAQVDGLALFRDGGS